MSKSIRELATDIIADQDSVYANDAGQGSGGPGMIDGETLAALVESGEIDDYEIITGEEAAEIIDATLAALVPRDQYDLAASVRWIVARRTADDGGSNPYRHYLILWDTEA